MKSLGEMSVTIGGEEFVLKCTLDAFRSIPATLGGFVGTFGQLAQAEPESCAFIVAAATGKGRDMKERERIAGLMFTGGGLNAETISSLTDYVRMLNNGGKLPTAATDDEGDDAGE